MNFYKKKILLVTLCLFFLLGATCYVEGATLYLASEHNVFHPGDIFVVSVKIDTAQGENINAIEAYIKFPPSLLKVIDVSSGSSILTSIISPQIDKEKGIISFAGIIPGGYSGPVLGDLGESNLLEKIIFQVRSDVKSVNKRKKSALVTFLDNSQILLNDGKGTAALLKKKGIVVDIIEGGKKSLRNEWKEELQKDTLPPEDFRPYITKIKNLYYLVFVAQDKQSGIDYYQVFESRRPQTKIELSQWMRAQSPYFLRDQSLRSYIYIQAVDKAGNKRLVTLEPQRQGHIILYENYIIWVIILFGLIVTYLSRRYLWKRY